MNEVQTSRPNLMAVLEDRGYRSTAPRQAIVNLLERKQSGFTVEEISEDLPSVGRATVYRTIKLLPGRGRYLQARSDGRRAKVQPVPQ